MQRLINLRGKKSRPGSKTKKFVVYSGIPKSQMDVWACVNGIPKMLVDANVKEISVASCYCCQPPAKKKAIIEFDAPSEESLSSALKKIGLPVESIMEVTKAKPK